MVIEYLTEIYNLLEEIISLSLSYFVNTEKNTYIIFNYLNDFSVLCL